MGYKTKLVSIGNSKGVRIPKTMLDQAGMVGEVVISYEADALVIRRAQAPRQGWRERFSVLGNDGEDFDTFQATENEFDRDEWQW